MISLSNNDHKKYELNILLDVASFCEKNDIKYFLAYGTLLGAVRHKGFIPWDDDVDIQMPREDYDKFIELYNKENQSCYKLIDPYSDMSKHSFVKVIDTRTIKIEKGCTYKEGEELGVDIDVFPIDGQPDDENEYKKFYNKKRHIYKYHYCNISSYFKRSLKAKAALWPRYLIAKAVGKKRIMDKIAKINSRYRYENSKFVGTTASLYNSINNRNPKSDYKEYILLEFEGHMLRAPGGYDAILRRMYGDYMKLPPKEKQVTHHANKVYLKENKNEKV